MPGIACPLCGNEVFAVATGSVVEIKGKFDAARCRLLVDHGQDEVDDALECEAMEKAVAAVLEYREKADNRGRRTAELPVPLAERFSRREYERRATNLRGHLIKMGLDLDCIIWNISPAGALAWCGDVRSVGQGSFLTLKIEDRERVPTEVRHVDEGRGQLGLMFLHGEVRRARMADWLSQRLSPKPA